MTIRLITEHQARRLAVAYAGYTNAPDCGRRADWGDVLIRVQKECGVEIVHNWMLQRATDRARSTQARIESVVAN